MLVLVQYESLSLLSLEINTTTVLTILTELMDALYDSLPGSEVLHAYKM